MFEDMGFHDARALAAMVSASRPLFARGLDDGSYRGWFVEAPAGRVVAGGGVLFLTFQPSPASPDPRRAWIVNMFTEPDARGRGFARRLVETMLEWCRAGGLPTVYLHASDAGRPLYESLGFIPNNEMKLTL